MTRLPEEFRRHAASLAATNPLAFPTAQDAEDSMARSYAHISHYKDVTCVSTGGYAFYKDSDGRIELWVSPDMVWRDG